MNDSLFRSFFNLFKGKNSKFYILNIIWKLYYIVTKNGSDLTYIIMILSLLYHTNEITIYDKISRKYKHTADKIYIHMWWKEFSQSWYV